MSIKPRLRASATLVAATLSVGGGALALAPQASASDCTNTHYVRDGIELTAALIDPPGTVNGTVDATGCNIGVFYDHGAGTVSAAVFGANYFGVAVVPTDGASADIHVVNAWVHNIGEPQPNGTQHGVGVYFNGFSGSAKVKVVNSTISAYQKGGIVANGPGARVDIDNNEVDGYGDVNYIAQNGIQFGWGAQGRIDRNDVTGNSYTGGADYAAGVLLYGDNGPGDSYTTKVQVVNNVLTGNQYGVAVENDDANNNYAPEADTATKNVVSRNTIGIGDSSACTVGLSTPPCAGVYDASYQDVVTQNDISGYGDNAITGPGADSAKQHKNVTN